MNLIISDAMHLRRNNVSDDKAFHGQYSREVMRYFFIFILRLMSFTKIIGIEFGLF